MSRGSLTEFVKKTMQYRNLMLQKLVENSEKKIGWQYTTDDINIAYPLVDNEFLINKLLEENAELIVLIMHNMVDYAEAYEYFAELARRFSVKLERAHLQEIKSAVNLEAADIGNIAMMLADNNGGL